LFLVVVDLLRGLETSVTADLGSVLSVITAYWLQIQPIWQTIQCISVFAL